MNMRELSFPVADFNGDGRSGICCAFLQILVIHTFDDEQTLLAKSITTGLENISFSYLPITKSGVCSIDEKSASSTSITSFPL